MAKKDNSFLGKLEQKKIELALDVKIDIDAAAFHEAEGKRLRARTVTTEKQVVAINQAQDILSAAGVHF